MNIEQASAFYYFESIHGEALIDVAMQSLLDGLESEHLILLASETDKSMSTVAPLFEACLRELGLDDKTREQHSIEAAKYYAAQFLSGEMNAESFGFKVGALANYESAPEILKEIYKNAVWHDECATEYGYAENYIATRKECEARITELGKVLCA
ncbi:MAG: hypothetical protein ACKVLM_06125 [Pseudomonadales bacterium]